MKSWHSGRKLHTRSPTPAHRRWFGRDRSRNVHKVREELEREGYPRLQMSLIVALTGGAGFGFSYGLLQGGVHAMALRYPVALGLAYLVFLLLIWLWLRTSASDWVDGHVDVPSGSWSPDNGDGVSSGQGGDFGGGGASGSFDGPTVRGSSDPTGNALGSLDIDGGDELAIPLAVIALVVGMALASLYVVYVAPALLAEVLVDGAISYALFRRLRDHERRHWIRAVVRHTFWPFLGTAVFLAGMGWAMGQYAPGALSIGQVIAHERALK